ncbi:MAG TPA: hypothetical protein VNT20_21190 [Flavisolibacter sp.]|nr:hypothetical protein [Flavisolibacter sp.]
MTEAKKIERLFNELQTTNISEFPKKGKLDITCKQGVYIIYNPNKEVIHVGRTPYGQDGLCQRLNNHLYNASSFSKKYLSGNGKLLRAGYTFKYIVVENPREKALLENLATGLLCPLHLGTSEKQSV